MRYWRGGWHEGLTLAGALDVLYPPCLDVLELRRGVRPMRGRHFRHLSGMQGVQALCRVGGAEVSGTFRVSGLWVRVGRSEMLLYDAPTEALPWPMGTDSLLNLDHPVYAEYPCPGASVVIQMPRGRGVRLSPLMLGGHKMHPGESLPLIAGSSWSEV